MGGDSENALLLLPSSVKSPRDPLNLTYITYFVLGVGCLLPWNTFITAVDYFSQIYPQTHVNRIFAVANKLVALAGLVFVVFLGRRWKARARINVGLGLYTAALLVVPLLEVLYIRGRVGLFNGFYVTVGAVVVCAAAQALVQSGVNGSAGELPERYMQAVVSGIAASGVIVSVLRMVTKGIYSQDSYGLRKSAILYFLVGISIIIVCIILYNASAKLPVMKHHLNLKNEEREKKGSLFGSSISRSSFWEILSTIKLYAFGVVIIFTVSLSIFPGYVTEDVHSDILKDWYPITLIFGYYIFDLIGKSLASIYLIKSLKITVGSIVGRVVFYPLFIGCLNGPQFLRTEIPVAFLACLLGFSGGYLDAVCMVCAPKMVPFEHAEVAGILMTISLVLGLAIGSVLSWLWVI